MKRDMKGERRRGEGGEREERGRGEGGVESALIFLVVLLANYQSIFGSSEASEDNLDNNFIACSSYKSLIISDNMSLSVSADIHLSII